MADFIEYEIVNWERREVWYCSVCKRYRHRPVRAEQLPAICCGQTAKPIDQYEQPRPRNVSEPSESP